MSPKNPRLWVTVTEQYVKFLDDLVKAGAYLSQGEAIRAAIRLLMEKHGGLFWPEEAEGR